MTYFTEFYCAKQVVGASVASSVVTMIENVGDTLSNKLSVGDEPVRIVLPKMSLDVRKSTVESLTNVSIATRIGRAAIAGLLTDNKDACVTLQVRIFLCQKCRSSPKITFSEPFIAYE